MPFHPRARVDRSRLTLGRFLEDAATAHAERIAIRFEGQSLTYRELELAARRCARGLIGAGVVKGARVALLMGNRSEWVVAAFAVARVGGVLVPVSTFATREEREHILRHSDASTLILQRSLLKHDYLEDLMAHPGVEAGAPGRLRVEQLPQLRRVFCLGLEASRGGVESWGELFRHGADVSEGIADAVADEVAPADDAMIIYTSGTTARPKGVLHGHRAPVIQSHHFAEYMRLVPEDRLFTTQPFFWTAGIAVSLGGALAAGARLLLQEAFDPARALELIERERATVIRAWPHQEKAMVDHASAKDRDLQCVKKVNFSSPLAVRAGLERDVWGTQGGYGLTETFTVVSDLPADAPARLRDATRGRPLPGVQIRIVDPSTGEACACGEEGEIAVRAETMMVRYQKVDPEDYLDPDGFFRTGDSGFLDEDGYLHWTGRLSSLIKTGGANVSPLEIERAMAGYPGVKLSRAVGVPHQALGEVVVLCVVPGAGATIEEHSVRAFLRARLASYKIPKRVLLFDEGALAFTGTQKIGDVALRHAALSVLESSGAEIDGVRYTGGGSTRG